MAAKRKYDDVAAETQDTSAQDRKLKKPKKGFSVGPDNLPDGTYKRKVQKIKKNLIEKAKTKKEYAKLKQKLQASRDKDNDLSNPQNEKESAMHPERVARLENRPPGTGEGNSPSEATGPENHENVDGRPHRQWRDKRRPKVPRFTREQAVAAQRKEDAEARRVARAEAQRQREEKQAERDRYRRAMERAKGAGKNGQRKLGRESGVLLDKVRRMMAE